MFRNVTMSFEDAPGVDLPYYSVPLVMYRISCDNGWSNLDWNVAHLEQFEFIDLDTLPKAGTA